MLPSSRNAMLKASNDGKGCSQFEGRRFFPSLGSLDTQRIRFLYLEGERYTLVVHKCHRVQTVQYTTALLAHMFAQSVTSPLSHFFLNLVLYGALLCKLEYVGLPNGVNDHIRWCMRMIWLQSCASGHLHTTKGGCTTHQ